MTREKLAEFDILRTISILIVVILIHIPNNYAYPFYIDLSPYTGYLLHTLGIDVAMGSFAFLSGFSLYLKKDNRNINSPSRLKRFLKKRFLRIFPLYWIALIVFLILIADPDINFLFVLAHIFGLQIIVAPIYGYPILTLWFIGIIVIYYLIFIILSFMGSLKKIIPSALAILFFFVILNLNFGLVDYRFFLYYIIFIVGIIGADIYISPQFNKFKEFLINKNRFMPLFIALFITILSMGLYFFFAHLVYTTFNSQYGTQFIPVILDMQPGIIESATAVLMIDLIIITYIIFSLSLYYFVMKGLRMIFKKEKLSKAFSLLAFSSYCVYLFHRPFIMLLSSITTGIFNIDMYARANFYIALLFVPIIFLLSYFVQKAIDWILNWASRREKNRNAIEVIVPPA